MTTGIYTLDDFIADLDRITREETSADVVAERAAPLLGRPVLAWTLDAMRVAHVVTILGEMAAAMARHDAAHRRDFSLDARANLAIARSFTAAEYAAAQRVRTRAIAAFQRRFAEVDAIMTPATGRTAPRINLAALPGGESDLSTTTEIMRFAFPPNFTGHPAICFPAGYDANGLPVGVQAIGRPWGERLLFRIAALAETLVARRAPRRWYPLLEP